MVTDNDDYEIEKPTSRHKITLNPRNAYKASFVIDPNDEHWPLMIVLNDGSHQFFSTFKKTSARALRDWLIALDLGD